MGRPARPINRNDAGVRYPKLWQYTLLSGVQLDMAEPFDSDHHMEKVWQAHKDELVEECGREYPLTRPWAWWRFDAHMTMPSPPHDLLQLLAMKEFTSAEIRLFETTLARSDSVHLRSYGRKYYPGIFTPRMKQTINAHVVADRYCYPLDGLLS